MSSGRDYYNTPGFAFKKNGKVTCNAPLFDLLTAEQIPLHDYGPDDHYIIREGKFTAVTADNLPAFTGYQLALDTARGCPYRCSYCCNDVYLRLYHGRRFLRLRGVDRVLQELSGILEKYPSYKSVFFSDDDFLFRSANEFLHFSAEYKKRINRPFGIVATPATCTEEKLAFLFDAGLNRIKFGLQTANSETQKIYKRYIPLKKTSEAAKIISRYEKIYKLRAVSFDLILDSPFESISSQLHTIRFLLSLPMRFELIFFSLTFYPGTSLTAAAVKEGVIEDIKQCGYRKVIQGPKLNAINLLFFLTKLAGQGKIPRALVRLFSLRPVFFLLNRKIVNLLLLKLGQWRYRRKYGRIGLENYL
jgi:radical SAM superfamily enzyme YgiQ (UPF0313 family)